MDLNLAIGHTYPRQAVDWNQRDLLLYALGIGAKANEPQFNFERHPDWHPFPLYPLVLPLKGDSSDIREFSNKSIQLPPGFPPIPNSKLIHAEQSIEILKPLPKTSGDGWTLERRIVGVKDTGKALISRTTLSLFDPSNVEYVRCSSSNYYFGNYNAGGFDKSIAVPLPIKPSAKMPERPADHQYTDTTSEVQAHFYRLSGDYNPLHVSPEEGQKLGFRKNIQHGLCTMGFAARHVILLAGDGDARRLRFINARFSSPVLPGDTLETSVWISKHSNGGVRVDFQTINKGTGKACLSNGVALLSASSSTSRL